MKIVSTVKLKHLLDELKDEFNEHEFIERESLDYLTPEDLSSVEVLIAQQTKLDEALLGQMPKLKWLVWYVAGVNKLPLSYMKERGIILTNARGIHKIQIAEFIFAYIMADYKYLAEFQELQENRGYKTAIRTSELYEQAICFIGTGEIAKNAARIARAFGMKTIGVNTDGRSVEHFNETEPLTNRRSAFTQADIIVNVLPETAETIELLTREDFEAMGKDALFINVGRGTVVAEDTLVKVLENRVIRKAALDVYEHEPLNEDNPLYQLANVIMTPHITGLSRHYNARATNIFKGNLKKGIEHSSAFINLVDYDKGY
ncbi:NAD(P)-dependent oxidoreductase [Macrococcus equipercicus]|uniref:Hydroxyacid dehydrogenase n=1 Tax=Macrococcus equipercicus TaxID=69967 RepID=A0A9Q9BUV1_9STAP|nr:NAD(P)-dependent oxidoreductase [Macrococcus equipercicus]UTH13373.1 hydroxyacid dehydrogenase [Macrococcus equipercicus]